MRFAYICSANFAVDVVIFQFRWSDKLELPFICWLVVCFLYVCQQFYKFLVIQEKFLIFQKKNALKLQLTHACNCICSSQQGSSSILFFWRYPKSMQLQLAPLKTMGKAPPPLSHKIIWYWLGSISHSGSMVMQRITYYLAYYEQMYIQQSRLHNDIISQCALVNQ